MKRESFVFYTSWVDATLHLPQQERVEIITAIVDYAAYGRSPKGLNPVAKTAFMIVKPQIDSNNKKFLAGRKGGAPARNQNAKKMVQDSDNQYNPDINQKQPMVVSEEQPKNNQKQPMVVSEEQPKNNQKQPNVNVNVNVNDNVNVNEGEKEKKKEKTASRFSPPSLDEIKNYVQEKNLRMTAETFYDHFTSNGWKVSGIAPMKDWKAAVRNWARREARLTHQKPEEIGVILHTNKDKYKNQKLW